MQQRLKVYAISVAAVALLVLGVAIQQGVFAQDDNDNSTPPAATSAQTGDSNASNAPATDVNAEAALKYKDFIETAASNLGVSDPMVVDTAVKDVLKQVVDEQVSSGAMSDDAASAVRDQIDSGNVAPLIFGQQSDSQTPTDDDSRQDDGGGAPQAPTEDDEYDYGY
jgi:cytoskeletal protein RodZ